VETREQIYTSSGNFLPTPGLPTNSDNMPLGMRLGQNHWISLPSTSDSTMVMISPCMAAGSGGFWYVGLNP
jgi:hypothetical protein